MKIVHEFSSAIITIVFLSILPFWSGTYCLLGLGSFLNEKPSRVNVFRVHVFLETPSIATCDSNFHHISLYDVVFSLKHHINGSACMTLLENSIGFVLKEFSLSMTPPIEHTTSTFKIYHHMTLSSV